MFNKSALFFVILVTINVTVSLQVPSFDHSLMPSDISRNNLVELMMKVTGDDATPTTIANFGVKLKEMLDNLENSQAKHKEVHGKMMAECKTEGEFREKEIKEANAALGKANESRTRCDASLQEAKKALPTLKDSHTTYSEELTRARESRLAEKKKFMERNSSFEEAITFLGDFIIYVKGKLAGHLDAFSFIGMSEKLVLHANKIGAMNRVVPVLAALASVQSEDEPAANDYKFTANNETGTKLNNLLIELNNSLINDKKTNADTESNVATIFAEYEGKVTAIINALAKNIKNTEAQIASMTKCVETEDAIISTAEAKVSRNTTLKINVGKMCEEFNGEFITATLNRVDEITTMQEIIEIVKKRFSNLPKDLLTYMESIKESFQEYINSTEFQAFVEYQRVLANDNIQGKALSAAENHVKDSDFAVEKKEEAAEVVEEKKESVDNAVMEKGDSKDGETGAPQDGETGAPQEPPVVGATR